MCSTDPFQYRWLKGYIYSICYHHHQIGSIHLSHCHHIFRGCVPEVFVTTYSITYCTYVPGKPGICFHYYCAVYDRVQIVGYVLACRSYSFVCTVHHLIVIIVQTYLETLNLKNACQIYFVECVSKIKHILSVIHYTICGAVYFSLPISLVMIERIYIYFVSLSSSNRKYELLPIVKGQVMKQWCALCVFLYSYETVGEAPAKKHAQLSWYADIQIHCQYTGRWFVLKSLPHRRICPIKVCLHIDAIWICS